MTKKRKEELSAMLMRHLEAVEPGITLKQIRRVCWTTYLKIKKLLTKEE
jgi:hypothetical protein